jgi:hypothetical protein
VAAISYILNSRELHAQFGLSYLQMVAVYLCGGFFAGIVSALLWGLTRWIAASVVAPVCWYLGTTIWTGKLRAMVPLVVMLVVTGFAVGSTLVAARGRLRSGSNSNAAKHAVVADERTTHNRLI